MKTRILPTLILLAVLLAACASASTPIDPPAAATQATTILEPSATLAAPTLEPATEAVVPTEAAAATPIPIATSRGPDLHATDPTTVNLASGQVQFVEFFRFT